jgi:phosphatidylglycerophosphate synthase
MTDKLVKEIPGIALTAGRYLLADRVARRVEEDKPIALDMAVLMIADVLDGVLLRKFNADTPVRRIADGVVDHASMARVAHSVSKKFPETKPYIKILTARAIAVGALNTVHLELTGEATKGRMNQKLTNIATAAFALTAVKGNKDATDFVGGLASGVALSTLPAHLKDVGVKHPEGIRNL